MSPKVSILLPTHNKAGLLSFAIRSVLSQSFQDFEVLVVGDGCTDNTAEIVNGFKDERLIWYNLPKAPNFGYANRNIALRDARGDLIAFMAHDDLWLSDHLEKFIPLFNDPNIEIAYSRPLWVIPKGMIVPGFFNLDYEPSRTFFLNTGNRIPAGCVVHRRECFSKYGYWNDQLTQAADWDLWIRIIKGGCEKNYAYTDIPTCLHFKADWHGTDYDLAFNFPAWRGLFDNGQMPAALKINIDENIAEQETVWNAMSSKPGEWNKIIRSAVRQIIDSLAFDGISAQTELDFARAELQIARDEISTIKNTITWKLYQRIIGMNAVRYFYLIVLAPLKKVFFR